MAKHSRPSLAIVFVAVVFSATIAGCSASLIPSPPLAQFVLTQTPANPRVQTIQFESKLVGKILPYNVLLPVNYNQADSRTKRYPVIYLLHGLTGHYNNWL